MARLSKKQAKKLLADIIKNNSVVSGIHLQGRLYVHQLPEGVTVSSLLRELLEEKVVSEGRLTVSPSAHNEVKLHHSFPIYMPYGSVLEG